MVIKKRLILYSAGFFIIILLGLFFFHFRKKIISILLPFIAAVILSYLLKPLVKKLEDRRIPRSVSILLIYLVFSLLIIAAFIFVVPELINNTKDLTNTLPDLTERYQKMFNKYMSSIQSSKWSPDIKNAIFKEIQNGSNAVQNYIMETLRKGLDTLIKIVSMILNLLISMIIAYYFIKDANFFREYFLSLTPRKWRNGLINCSREINAVLSNFIQGQLLTALIVGILESIGLLLINLKYPFVLGLIGGVANIIPYFGPFLGAIPAVAIALIDSPAKALWAVVVFTVVQQIDNAFISPKIIEGKLGLHPVTTILAVLIGGEFFGIVGMLVSVPVFAIIKVLLKRTIEAIV
jgi:sporulation integral membrane protein YtvI